ncbi:hypothetical protein B9Z19DRAFT_1126390 [Tuber borchii]|uniref:Uncharacterized protein n=1 Tax=Tuber borchii TaxID=42251 RepID=A0A2T6ZT31_TUBBO|nr:hypothetical protein B9Z19DRAFT_1126390 [Tuber borchii]
MSDKIFQEIKEAIETRKHDFLTFHDVDPGDYDDVIHSLQHPANHLERRSFRIHWFAGERYLKVVIPSDLHEGAGVWVIDEISEGLARGGIPQAWVRKISVGGSPQYKNFIGAYKQYSKEGDLTIVPHLPPDWTEEAKYPSVILECGWTESAEHLKQDATLWQKGTGGNVRVVIQVKFYKRQGGRIGARAWISRTKPPRDPSKTPKISIETYEVLPPPPVAAASPAIKFEEFFAGCCPPGIDPDEHVILNLDNLRAISRRRIRRRGNIPDE